MTMPPDQNSPPPPPLQNPYAQQSAFPALTPQQAEASSKKLAAGLCAILIGTLGIHKFILGYTTAGIITLLVSILTCGIGAIVMHVFGIIEGIIYLTKSDADFYQTYMVNKREWF